MNGLDLFSGVGGLTKALSGYVTPRAYCEIEPYARGVLLSRMADGSLPTAAVWDDVRSLHGRMLPPIEIVYGGFPCQDISVAGKQVGLGGERSSLFFEIVRLATETKAEWVFLENVPNIRTKGLGRVLKTLADSGYDCRWCALSAADVGANHKRERWFLLAHAERTGLERYMQSIEQSTELRRKPAGGWAIEPNVGRVANGVPKRVDRLRALGNAVVPAQAREAFERLMGLK